MWREAFGHDKVLMLNDDKPALRLENGRWYAYGTPWSGKSGINQNKKVPLGGICFLKRGEDNRIRRLSAAEAVPLMFMQTRRALFFSGRKSLWIKSKIIGAESVNTVGYALTTVRR